MKCKNCKFWTQTINKKSDADRPCNNNMIHEQICYWEDISFKAEFGCIYFEERI